MPRGREPNRWLVDGKWMTRNELAAQIGITPNALWCMARSRGVSIPAAAMMYRTRMVMPGTPGQHRHCIHGRWMSTKEAADECGISQDYLTAWRRKHDVTLEEAYDHFRAMCESGYTVRMGRIPREYWVHGKQMTVRAAAERFGLVEQNIRHYSYRHHCSINTAVNALIRRREDAAVREIMNILNL